MCTCTFAHECICLHHILIIHYGVKDKCFLLQVAGYTPFY